MLNIRSYHKGDKKMCEDKPIRVKSSFRVSKQGTPSYIKPHRRKAYPRRVPIIIQDIPEDFVKKVPHGNRR